MTIVTTHTVVANKLTTSTTTSTTELATHESTMSMLCTLHSLQLWYNLQDDRCRLPTVRDPALVHVPVAELVVTWPHSWYSTASSLSEFHQSALIYYNQSLRPHASNIATSRVPQDDGDLLNVATVLFITIAQK